MAPSSILIFESILPLYSPNPGPPARRSPESPIGLPPVPTPSGLVAGSSTHPNQANVTGQGLPYGGMEAENGSLYHTLVFRRNRQAADLSFHIEASEDLAAPEAWQILTVDPADVTVLDADVDGDGTAELMQVRVNVSGKTVHFLRVRVTR